MTSVEEIKDRLGIAEVVGSYIQLQKAGVNFRAKCPFHNEKTPSFFVSPTRNTYYCFGCGQKGDIFSFVETFEGLDFKGALKVLANRAGVVLRYDKGDDERDRLVSLMETATLFFEQMLKEKKEAVDYLKNRGLKEETISGWRVGYAPVSWRDLTEHLRRRGYTDKEIETSGMAKRTEKGIYDRFRGRIMFPLSDASGRVIAFSGRIFDPEGDIVGKEPAKYINSPETPLFSKSRALYGFHKAKGAIRKNNFSIVVEGQMDLLMSHQGGYGNTVALSGTALTPDQLTLLKRLSDNIVFALDADRAGVASAGKSAEAALSLGMDVKVAALPSGLDPADLIKKDIEEWKRVIRESKHIIEFLLLYILEKEKDPRKQKLLASKTVLPYLARITNRIDQSHFAGMIADKLSTPVEAILSESRKLEKPSVFQKESAIIDIPALKTRKEAILQKIAGIIMYTEQSSAAGVDRKDVASRVKKIGAGDIENLHSSPEEEQLFEAEALVSNPEGVVSELNDLLTHLEGEVLGERYEEALRDLREAEKQNDQEKVSRAMKICQDIARERQALLKSSQ